jgi:hypothetical protein
MTNDRALRSHPSRRHRDVRLGRLGASLLAVVALLGALALPSATASAQGENDPPAPPGYTWMHINFFLDSKAVSDPFEAAGCDGAYGKGNAGCQGRYTGLNMTWPFSESHGTAIWHQVPGSQVFELDFFTLGAEIRGRVSAPATESRYEVSSVLAPWATSGHSGNDPSIAAGQKGGPLFLGYFDHDCASTPELAACDATFNVQGWLLVTAPPSAEAPESTTTTTTTAVPVPETSTTAAVPAAVTTPRFTG